MPSKKETWRPWPEPDLAGTVEVSSRGRVRTVPRQVVTSAGVLRFYRKRELAVDTNGCVALSVGGRTVRRSARKAVALVFGEMPAKWA